jgi:hypothetical protein
MGGRQKTMTSMGNEMEDLIHMVTDKKVPMAK